MLKTGSQMAERIDALTRLDRNKGTGTILITHTLKDLTQKNYDNLAERIGYYAITGTPKTETQHIKQLTNLTQKEEQHLTNWTTPPTWNQNQNPPGQGKILIKTNNKPAIPTQLTLTGTEKQINNTNGKWN